MLLWFPTPYPDELLYSVFARYHVRSGNTSPKMTTVDIFGRSGIKAAFDVPAHLDALLTKIGPNWDIDGIIFNHTMYSYYAPFLLPAQAEQVKESMVGDKGSTIHTRLGIAASNIKVKENFWVCSQCIKEDMNRYGETYWHRIHQAPAVYICPKHKVMLEETNVSSGVEHQLGYVMATPTLKKRTIKLDGVTEVDLKLLLKIAQITESLLSNRYPQLHSNLVREKYVNLLARRGFIAGTGNTKRKEVYCSFQNMFSQNLLKLLQSPVSFERIDWLTLIFQKHHKSFHPLRHILIMLFLEIELSDLQNNELYRPFGNGPWLCLNKICVNYHKRVVTSLKITRCSTTGKPVGTFTCDCGFVFSRSGPDLHSDDQYKIGNIKEYGMVWENKLSQLIKEKHTQIYIANEMKVNRGTVKKYATKLELETSSKAPIFSQKDNSKMSTDYTEQLKEKRDRWLMLQELHPNKSKSELRKEAPDIYMFLYRYDSEWLKCFSPARKITQPSIKRVDWEKRDEEILIMIKEVVSNWDNDVEALTRITITSIARKINKLSLLHKKRDKLPRTISYIRQVEESIEAFQIRRVEFIIDKLKKENEPIIEWEIHKKAGLNGQNISNEVKRVISLRVKEYDTGKRIR